MRVLFIGPLPEPVTGQALACQVLLDDLALRHQVTVVNLSKPELRQGVSSWHRVWSVGKILAAVWRGRRGADLIYFTVAESFAGNMKDLVIYQLCAGRLGRMVVHLLGGAGLRRLMLDGRGWRRALNVAFLRRIGAAVVEGSRQRPIFEQALPAGRVHVVPNFAEDHLFAPADAVERKFAQPAPLRILFLSNLLPGKGHAELVEAFASLAPEVRDGIAIDFVGACASEEERRTFVARLGAYPQLRYHGAVFGEAKRRLLHEAHVFCLPTYYPYEGQPFTILEAYASGCAVITTDHSGIGDVFSGEVNGYEVQPRSVDSLAGALRRAAADPDRLAAIGRANLELARERYRTSAFTARMRAVFETVAAGGGQ